MEKHQGTETRKQFWKNGFYQLIVVLPQTNDNIILNTDESPIYYMKMIIGMKNYHKIIDKLLNNTTENQYKMINNT